jgi:hypothetical protein
MMNTFLYLFVSTTSALYFQFDTRSGDYQYGPDGSVQYSTIPDWMGNVVVSNGFNVLNGQFIPRGMQIWTVESTGYYDILAGGASGASYYNSKLNYIAGRGIVVTSRQYLQAGEKIIILIGMSNTNCDTRNSGGGGGTFISKYAATDAFDVKSQHTPLLVAGGGGGASTRDPYTGIDGTLTRSGTKCSFNPPSNVATNGGGGGAYGTNGGDGVDGTTYYDAPGSAGGGGGFVGDGGSVKSQPLWRSRSFLQGGTGAQWSIGICNYICTQPGITCGNNAAGFGGGGEGTGISGGGGGGYSGGQGCAAPDSNNNLKGYGSGGGGGSYDANNALIATQYTVWDSAQFGPTPASFSNGYINLHGIAAVSLESSGCAANTYFIGSVCQSCSYCDNGYYAKGCGGNSAGTCTECTNT